ncbi:uncharacterized protein PAC_11618 [Phialocephala subalpina]|uniref:2EXR domain-containing protein n=1 Tax=Phialocephala subalpina TaxID=576137 RepID=A0A1L7X9M1_9HELO|nr:uncharacterized protein PAC_11618 [Phialocephala subalpina]
MSDTNVTVPLLALAPPEYMTSLIPMRQSGIQRTTAPTKFLLFPKLAPELRQMIFKFALPSGDGQRIIPLDLEIFDNPKGDERSHLNIYPSGHYAAMGPIFYDSLKSSAATASWESREVYLSASFRNLTLDNGIIRFLPDIRVHICGIGSLFFHYPFVTAMTNFTWDKRVLQQIDHLVVSKDVLLELTRYPNGIFSKRHKPKQAAVEFLASFKSLTILELPRLAWVDY